MKHTHLSALLGIAASLLLTFAPTTRAEDSPMPAAGNPTPPPAVQPARPETTLAPAAPVASAGSSAATTAESKPVEAPAKAVDATPMPLAAPAAAVESSSSGLRRLDGESEEATGDHRTKLKDAIQQSVRKHVRVRDAGGDGNERVAFAEDVSVGKDETVSQAVAVFGSATVDGRARDQAVSVFGNTTVNGSVGDQAVSVFGDTTINGSVGGQAVAVGGNMVVNGRVGGELVVVGGDVDLGPGAEVNGEVVLVGGRLRQDPGAVLHGHVQRVHIPPIRWLFAWMRSALFKARLLSFAPGAGWAWVVAGAFLAFYVFLALVFRSGVEKCAETLEKRPGFTILTALLTMLAMPLVFVILALTGLGVVVIPFIAIGLFVTKLFGRAAMLAWIGRRVSGLFGAGLWSHVAVSVLVGGVIVALLYTVPILALIVAMLLGSLGLGAVIYTLILSMRRNGPKPVPAATPPAPPAASGVPPPLPLIASVAPGAQTASSAVAGPAIVTAMPPVISAMSLPRAGFWIRTAALLIDLVLCCVIIQMIPWISFWHPCLFLLATYGAVMWKLRGTTVGGSIFHLKVVRLDDRPLDWTTAIVRALSCFLSLIVVGLGFLWVAFDDEKQSWHDKIVGTTVVKVPKSVALI